MLKRLPLRVLMAAIIAAGCFSRPGVGPSGDSQYDLNQLPQASVEEYALSADGSTVVLSYWDQDRHASLLRLDTRTGDVTTLLDWPDEHLRSPSFTDDGKTLAFIATKFGDYEPLGARHRIMVLDMESGQVRQVAEDGHWVQVIAISPAGTGIVAVIGTERGFETPWLDPVNQADLHWVPTVGGELRRVSRHEINAIRDVVMLDEDTALMSAFHKEVGHDPAFQGTYEVTLRTGATAQVAGLEPDSEDFSPLGLCRTGPYLSSEGNPVIIKNLETNESHRFGYEGTPYEIVPDDVDWYADACADGFGNIFFLCRDDRWGPMGLMRINESDGIRQSIFPANAHPSTCEP